jgi:hypothetical protein
MDATAMIPATTMATAGITRTSSYTSAAPLSQQTRLYQFPIMRVVHYAHDGNDLSPAARR